DTLSQPPGTVGLHMRGCRINPTEPSQAVQPEDRRRRPRNRHTQRAQTTPPAMAFNGERKLMSGSPALPRSVEPPCNDQGWGWHQPENVSQGIEGRREH